MSFWDDIVGIITQIGAGNAAGVSAPGGPATQAVGQANPGQLDAILAIWTDLRDGKMWRSLGWILLGIVVMLLGVGWWIGPSAARGSPAGAVAAAGRRFT